MKQVNAKIIGGPSPWLRVNAQQELDIFIFSLDLWQGFPPSGPSLEEHTLPGCQLTLSQSLMGTEEEISHARMSGSGDRDERIPLRIGMGRYLGQGLALKLHSECRFIPCHISSQEEGLAGLSWKWRNPRFQPMLFMLRDL